MELQKAYKEKMAAQLTEWSAQIKLLEAKLETASAEMKVQQAKHLQDLRAKQHVALDNLQQLGVASGEAWEQARKTADKIWADLKTGVAEAHAKFH